MPVVVVPVERNEVRSETWTALACPGQPFPASVTQPTGPGRVETSTATTASTADCRGSSGRSLPGRSLPAAAERPAGVSGALYAVREASQWGALCGP